MPFQYRTELTDQILKSPQAKRVLSYLSPVYGDAYVMLWLIQIIGTLLDRQTELTDDYILQVFPQTATWSIGLWEEQCAVKPDPEWDLSQRRWAVIAGEKPTSPMGPERLAEIAGNAAGGLVTIQESTSLNTFQVTFWEEPDGAPLNRRRAFQEIERFKPAHLIYKSVLRMPPVVLENRNRLLFVGQSIHLRVSNLVEVIYLDGRRNLDGSWVLSQRAIKGAAFYRLLFSMRAANRCGQALSWAVRASAHATGDASLAGMQVCRYSANNLGMGETRGKGVGLSRFTLACRAENRQGMACSVTSQVDRRLDGTFLLDGTKTLNSGITRSEL